jgi:hypothetical protein
MLDNNIETLLIKPIFIFLFQTIPLYKLTNIHEPNDRSYSEESYIKLKINKQYIVSVRYEFIEILFMKTRFFFYKCYKTDLMTVRETVEWTLQRQLIGHKTQNNSFGFFFMW